MVNMKSLGRLIVVGESVDSLPQTDIWAVLLISVMALTSNIDLKALSLFTIYPYSQI